MTREWQAEELLAQWTLLPGDWPLVGNKHGPTRLGFAVLLKFFQSEGWNSANDFILFGHGGEMATNRRDDQELMMLTLHLLQNCLVFINTLMIQRVLQEPAWEQRLTADDRRGLTPLICSHISPYGTFLLDMRTRLDLEQPEESAQAKPEYSAAPAIGRAVRPPRQARAQVQQLGLFDAAPEPHH